MEFTPVERVILSQLRQLYGSKSQREHPLGKIISQWPVMHVEAYTGVLRDLISKKLLEVINEGHVLRITDAGLRAMGLVEAAETKSPTMAGQHHRALKPRRLGMMGHLVFIAAAASAIVLLWLALWRR